MLKILQIGEGNFLRAFFETYIQNLNDSGTAVKVTVCQPRNNNKIINALKNQNSNYNVISRGRLDGKVVDEVLHINCVENCVDTANAFDSLLSFAQNDELKVIVSNTTEAGITFNENDRIDAAPDISFPAKLTLLLHNRFAVNKTDIVILPVELIENNGDALKKCVLAYCRLWNLENDFTDYVNEKCHFCNTLVDRIVTGHTEYENDSCAVACEPYSSWIIQADDKAKEILPFDTIPSITYSDNLDIYRERKVKILNGTHTATVLAGYKMGYYIVRDMIHDKAVRRFIDKLLSEEIIPTIKLDAKTCQDFADSVIERFDNPFIDHKLLDISLNSVSKFKSRCLVSILDYYKLTGNVPNLLSFSFAALIDFYYNPTDYEINDSDFVLSFFAEKHTDIIFDTLANIGFWDSDLNTINGLYDKIKKHYDAITECGYARAMEDVVNE